jgi:hypothetical protein
MMITNFNKRKCLLMEIVKIPELFCNTRSNSREEEVQFRDIIKFFQMHEFVSSCQRLLLAANEARLYFFIIIYFPPASVTEAACS